MPKRVRWGSGAPRAKDIDQWDRSSQYQPYDGPEPPNSLFYFKIKQLKQRPATGGKLPSLQIGLELVPRRDRPDEKKYKGYFIMDFPPISPQTMFRYVPFLDALGVSGADLLERTVVDDDGNILKIGRWINDGSQYVGASLKDDSDASGNYRKGVGTYTAIETKRKKAAASEDEESEEDYEETEEDEVEEDEADEEESDEDSEDEGFEEDDLDWDEEE